MDVEVLNNFIHSFDKTLGEELLTPTRIYVNTILSLVNKFTIKGIAHITGGGFYENIPRIMPEGLRAKINGQSFDRLPVFDMLLAEARMPEKEAFGVFNMGIGMVLAVDKRVADNVLAAANELGEKAFIIGEVQRGDGGIKLCL